MVAELRVGNLQPLQDALVERSDPPQTAGCSGQLEVVPELWLVDRDGRAIRAAWPLDACGAPKAAVRSALSNLSVLDDRRTPLPRYRPL